MTRKHFTVIARMVKSYTDSAGSVGVEKLAYDLTKILADANPNFDRERFNEACGLTPGGALPARKVRR